ncbi:MAG: sodium-dependent transporter [Candidatus Omnitrophica bacterium]|nr:sodium-dependent transporter [Candidatus Omnitrophota bacterium]
MRQKWGSKIGIILAVAGSAVGLGNFLRFPSQAAQNGGGAFMIPYFISLFLLGIPLMWIEWAIGRYGGLFGHGTAPLIFNRLWKNRVSKYFGAIGVFGPLAIFIYYIYIESWLLGYAFYSLHGSCTHLSNQIGAVEFLRKYQGISAKDIFLVTYLFFILTFIINFTIIYKGIKGGIERLCKFALPVLFVFAIVIAIRVITLGAPVAGHPDWNISNGFGFLWNPDFSSLLNAKIWLSAAGQIFFTLSVGIGVVITYASYLSKGDDIVLSGLTASSLNEFAEVILGGSIVIPLAFAFFGLNGAQEIAQSGSFNISFVSMPLIFSKINYGMVFSFMWFFLLFLAGLTSSVSLLEPAVAFLSDDLGITRKKAVTILGALSFIICQFPVFFLARGVVDEIDFWAGSFFLVVFALAECVLFVWIFGIDKAWSEMHHGAELRIPRFYKFIIKYITPSFLIFILGFWFFQQAVPTFFLKGVARENVPYIVATRAGFALLFIIIALLVRKAHKKHLKLGQ